MEPDISMKNTKSEILSAYEEVLKQLKNKKSEEPKKEQERQKQETLVKQAGTMSHEKINKDISGLKTEIATMLDKLNESFVAEFRKFEELQQAIQIEKKNLEDLYQLSATTDSLAAMLTAQKEKSEQFEQEMAAKKAEMEAAIKQAKAEFDEEMAEKKLQWKKEQEINQARQKEETETLQKKRTREEEEYQYNLKQVRKKETDLYEEKKQKLEKELVDKKALFEKEYAEREASLKAAEKELQELRAKNVAFPNELEKAVAAAVKANTEKLQAEYKFAADLRAKETEGELRLKDQTIETLRAKIKDIETLNKELAQKTTTAETNVKDIAIKAIESSGKMHYFEKAKENVNKD
ncbi:MAG TPA: hypothetical protein ENN08_05240 [Bacteroidales bacterium]|nr:hypothetical protein [Bacteroidales bacterium]